ncbi:acyltransferase [Granulicella sp. WH15]|uniref:acyltransferase family protein n=1 Tax=Granulicella sp. WH15 TaxID=2602070 RepID=UPI0013674511|nr:acyltransferase [Granulicella sp. WH15]QHN03858.1 acyltransferase [Granulicella sp. WH15]
MPPSQVTPSIRFHGLDTLRTLAIVVVMLYHLDMQELLPSVMHPIAKIGWVGVDLFFVLSGFLIGSQLLKPYLTGRQPSFSDFYMRRAYRILPAFFVVLLLYLIMPLWREAPGPYAGWQYASFTWNLLLLGYPEHRAFSHIWSLCVEEHFYLFFPLLLVLLRRKPSSRKTASVLLFLVVGGIGLRAWLLHSVIRSAGDQQALMMMKYIYYPTYSRLDGLVMGVSLAIVRTFKTHWWACFTKHSEILAILGLACVLGALQLCGFDYPAPDLPLSILFAFPALACGFGLLVSAAVCEKGFLRTRVPGASTIAALAFSLYLTHKSVAHATHLLLPALTAQAGWRSFAVYVVTCLGGASLLYFGVERPFISFRARCGLRKAATGVDREVHLDPAI